MDYNYILNNFYHVFNMPCVLFENEEPVLYYPDFQIYKTLIEVLNVGTLPFDKAKNVDYAEIDSDIFIGKIKLDKKADLIIGPCVKGSEKIFQNPKLQNVFKKGSLYSTELMNFFDGCVKCDIISFLHTLSFQNFIINREIVYSNDISHSPILNDKTESEEKLVKKPIVHNTQNYENKLFFFIKYGQPDELKKFMKNVPANLLFEECSSDALKSAKYHVVCSSILGSRAAVAGGASYNEAMTVSESFLKKADSAFDNISLAKIHYNMLNAFAKLVANAKIKSANSILIIKINAYVHLHLCEQLTVGNIADEFGICQSYLSQYFKKETGLNLSQYINKCKIDEVKRLLLSTNMTIVEIANHLNFSSQAHMQTVFKKVTGTTPKAFRDDRNNYVLLET